MTHHVARNDVDETIGVEVQGLDLCDLRMLAGWWRANRVRLQSHRWSGGLRESAHGRAGSIRGRSGRA
jgi:hypothetical protein